jgi:hypothetical protein
LVSSLLPALPSGAPVFIIDARWGKETIMNDTCVTVACRKASGLSDLPVFIVQVTDEEYDLGIHYEKAEALAEAAGYERPFVCFDDAEQDAIRETARRLGAGTDAGKNLSD